MLPSASPASLGLDTHRLQRAFALLQDWLDDGVVTAVAAAVVRHGQVAATFSGGTVSGTRDGSPVTAGSLFHLASIGKPMTAFAVMLLVEEGRVALDDPVASILPEFSGAEREGITVRHLLSHTSGLAQDADLTGLPPGTDTTTELRTYLHAQPVVPIGSKVEYSNVGYGLLGLIVEAVSGQSFATFMRERLFQPAAMESAYLAPPEELSSRIVHVAGTLDPGSPYERFNSAYARRQTHPAGHVIGTALDVAQFFQMFLSGGRAGGTQVASPSTVRLMTTSHTDGLRGGIEGFMAWEECAWGLGFDLRGAKRPHFSGEYTSPATFGHTGVAGTFAWADPAADLVCVMLANHMLYNRWNSSRWSRFSTVVSASVVG
jgi:CubicO group peptidase (beta-lactamase class C family)